MNRGSGFVGGRGRGVLIGFNEAPIHESGKSPRSPGRTVRRPPLQ